MRGDGGSARCQAREPECEEYYSEPGCSRDSPVLLISVLAFLLGGPLVTSGRGHQAWSAHGTVGWSSRDESGSHTWVHFAGS